MTLKLRVDGGNLFRLRNHIRVMDALSPPGFGGSNSSPDHAMVRIALRVRHRVAGRGSTHRHRHCASSSFLVPAVGLWHPVGEDAAALAQRVAVFKSPVHESCARALRMSHMLVMSADGQPPVGSRPGSILDGPGKNGVLQRFAGRNAPTNATKYADTPARRPGRPFATLTDASRGETGSRNRQRLRPAGRWR